MAIDGNVGAVKTSMLLIVRNPNKRKIDALPSDPIVTFPVTTL